MSVQTQERDCLALCKARKWEVGGVFRDVAKYRSAGKLVQPSGTRLDRPGYRQVLAEAEAGAVDVIVAWKADRLYRGLPVFPLAQALERRPGLQVEYVKETFDRRMLLIQAGIAEIELQNIRERTNAGRAGRVERGQIISPWLPYGYRMGADGRAEVDPSEAGVVRRIFELYCKGAMLLQIVGALERGKVRPRRSKPWSKSTVCNVLEDPETYRTGVIRQRCAGRTHAYQAEPIIDAATHEKWRKVREINKRLRGGGKRDTKYTHLLKGLVTCPCGWTMVVRFDKRWPAGSTYRCQRRGHAKSVDPACPRGVRMGDLDALVWDVLRKLFYERERIEAEIEQKAREAKRDVREIDTGLAEIKQELAKGERERAWVIRQAKQGTLTEAEISRELGDTRGRIDELEKQQASLEGQKALASLDESSIDVLEDWDRFSHRFEVLSAKWDGRRFGSWHDSVGFTWTAKQYGWQLGITKRTTVEDLERARDIARRELARRFIREVRVSLNEAGEKVAEVHCVLSPTNVGLSETISIPRGKYPGD